MRPLRTHLSARRVAAAALFAAVRPAGLLAAVLVAYGSSPAQAQEVDARLAIDRHAACADAGESSGVCAEMVTAPCLARSGDLGELTVCRGAMARALEAEARALTDRLGAEGERARAVEIAAGAERTVRAFCDHLPSGPERLAAHEARCALMTAHVTVYHLRRRLRELEREV